MDRPRLAALGAFLAGCALLAVAAAKGDVQLRLLLIFPLLTATGPLAAAGMLLVVLGVGLAMLGSLRAAAPPPGSPEGPSPAEEPAPTRALRHGGVVLLGPIPIVWGSDRRILPWMVGLGAGLLALTLAAWWLLGR